MALATHILMPEEDDERGIHQKCGLREVDLSLNQIGFRGVFAIEKGLKQTTEKRIESQLIQVDLEGNMVFQEVSSLF